ncbi:hypothetical protein N0V90_007159 [Kalmusia sp. IMI 367209]|nr:hypothetical protein N0V90_007159 [Kalmusia sp. IMI 367209]
MGQAVSTKEGIDICTNEWQSRSPAEILLKALAIHFSTAVLLSQYAARCGMPFEKRCWFVLRALLFPAWSTVAALLDITSRVAAAIFFSISQKFAADDQLEVEPGGPLQAVYASVGMHAKQNQDDMLPHAEHQEGQPVHLPQTLSLGEVDRLTTSSLDGQTQTLRCRRVKSSRPRTKRLLSIILIIVYLIQATTTLVLEIRRSQFTTKKWLANGSPVKIFGDYTIYWWRPQTGFREGFAKAPAVTPADSSTAKLAIYGILTAVFYLCVELAGASWEYTTSAHEAWRFAVDSPATKTQRCCIGICTSYLADYALHRYLGTLSMYRRTWALFQEVLKLSTSTTRDPVVFVVGVLGVLMFANSKAFGYAVRRWGRLRSRAYLAVHLLPQALLDSFDFAYQDPSEFVFLERGFDSAALEPAEQEAVVEGAWHLRLRYYLYVGAWAVPIIVFGVLSLYEDLYTSRPIMEKFVLEGGCVQRADLDAWKWKDPLADMLWAF